MKKTLLALMVLAGIAGAAQYTMDEGGNLYAGPMTLTFTIDTLPSSGTDVLALYYQATNQADYYSNAFVLGDDGVLSLQRGHSYTLTDGELTNDSSFTMVGQEFSPFKGNDNENYELTSGSYTLKYLGGGHGTAAAELYKGEEKVASFTGGSFNMFGIVDGNPGDDEMTLITNDSYKVVATSYLGMPSIPEPTTATLSLLALAGLAARRRRR